MDTYETPKVMQTFGNETIPDEEIIYRSYMKMEKNMTHKEVKIPEDSKFKKFISPKKQNLSPM